MVRIKYDITASIKTLGGAEFNVTGKSGDNVASQLDYGDKVISYYDEENDTDIFIPITSIDHAIVKAVKTQETIEDETCKEA